MSLHRQNMRPFCSKCRRRYKTLRPLTTSLWQNVEFVSELPGEAGALMRCNSCGHEYKSNSKAAWALIFSARAKARKAQSEVSNA